MTWSFELEGGSDFHFVYFRSVAWTPYLTDIRRSLLLMARDRVIGTIRKSNLARALSQIISIQSEKTKVLERFRIENFSSVARLVLYVPSFFDHQDELSTSVREAMSVVNV